jgi:hypothetical protein
VGRDAVYEGQNDELVVAMLIKERKSTVDKLMDEMRERQAKLASSSEMARTKAASTIELREDCKQEALFLYGSRLN